MSIDLDALAGFVGAFKSVVPNPEADVKPRPAEVMRKDVDGTIWVRELGGTTQTPVVLYSAQHEIGDIVQVQTEHGASSIVGNFTDPSASGNKMVEVTQKVVNVEKDVFADRARIVDLEADNVVVNGRLTAANAQIVQLQAADVTITGKLTAAEGDITNLKAKDATIEGNLTAATGRIDDLEADRVSTADLQATNARIGTVEADYLKAADMEAEEARVDGLLAKKATVTDLNAATGRITTLESTKANIADIEANYITADDIEATYMHADMSNSDVAWIQNGVIANGAISSAMINDVSANKLTAGTINGSVINVTNLNADNITAGTINGQRIGTGSLSLDKLSENVYTEAEVDAKLSDMQSQIDGAIETWTGTDVPTLNNAPASAWTTVADRDKHVGDVYFNTTSGYNYRFTKSGSTYSWLQIKDTDITNALQRIQTAEGQITQFDSDISTLKTDTGELKTKTQSLETSLGDKVDTTTFNELEETVDGHTQTISQHTTAIQNKADTSTVNQVTNRVTKAEQDISGINTTIGQLQTTVESKADGSTVTTISNKLNTVSDTVDGHTQTISSVQSTLSSKADNSTVQTLRSEYNETKTTVSGHETRLTATESVASGVRSDLDNLEIGGRNLLHKSKLFGNANEVNREVGRYNGNEVLVVRDDGFNEYQANAQFRGISVYADAMGFDVGEKLVYSANVRSDSTVGTTITFYCMAFDASGTRVQSNLLHMKTRAIEHDGSSATIYSNGSFPAGAKERITVEIIWLQAAQDLLDAGGNIRFTIQTTSTDWTAGNVAFWAAKLEQGNMPTPWTPAPEDLETEVTSLKTDYANYKQTTTESLSTLGSTVQGIDGRVTTAESTITQHATDIEAKVSKDGVIAAINLSTEQSGGSAAKISADKVNITGEAVFSAINGDTSTTKINGGKIDASSITISQSQVTNLENDLAAKADNGTVQEQLSDLADGVSSVSQSVDDLSGSLDDFSSTVTDSLDTLSEQADAVAGQIADAVAEEKEAREASESALSSDIEAAQSDISSHGERLQSLESAVHITADGIDIAKAGSSVTTRYTNNALQFLVNGENVPVTYIGVDEDGVGKLFVTNAVVVQELQFGDWAFTQRKSGHLSLKWIGTEE